MPFTITSLRVFDTHATPDENSIVNEFWPDYTFYRLHTIKGVDTSVCHPTGFPGYAFWPESANIKTYDPLKYMYILTGNQ